MFVKKISLGGGGGGVFLVKFNSDCLKKHPGGGSAKIQYRGIENVFPAVFKWRARTYILEFY